MQCRETGCFIGKPDAAQVMARLASTVLCLLVCLAPMALGSNRPLAWDCNAAGAGLVGLAAAAVLWAERRAWQFRRFGLLIVPVSLWTVALAWAGIQLLPLGGSALAHPAWKLLGPLSQGGELGAISVNPGATETSLLRFLTYVIVFLSTCVIARDASRANRLLRVILVAAVLYALYGLLRLSMNAQSILWFDEPVSQALTATFINRNSAATYFGVCTCISFAFLLRKFRRLAEAVDAERGLASSLERLLSAFVAGAAMEFAGFIVLLTATLLTQSRAGIVATIAALCAGAVVQLLRRRADGGIVAVLAGSGALAAVAAGLQMSGSRFALRLIGTDALSDERLAVYRDTLAAISDHFWLGSGLGTFPDIFPLYRNATPVSGTIWDKAHSDYLEILLGLGVPGGLAVILGVVAVVLVCFSGALGRRRDSHLPLAGAMTGCLIGLHGLVDFSLQIQAVALTAVVILGVGVAQSTSSRKPKTELR